MTAATVLQAVPFLAVSDMDRSLRFYVEGLAFEIHQQWLDDGTARWCWLRRGGGSLMLQDFRRDGGARWSPEGRLGLGVTVLFLSDDALAVYREVTARGIQATRPIVGNGMWVTSLHDPDGYRVDFESYTNERENTVWWGDATGTDPARHDAR